MTNDIYPTCTDYCRNYMFKGNCERCPKYKSYKKTIADKGELEMSKAKYKLVKKIITYDLIMDGACTEGLQRYLRIMERVYPNIIKLSCCNTTDWAKVEPLLSTPDIQWLLDNKYIKKREPELTFAVGEVFEARNFRDAPVHRYKILDVSFTSSRARIAVLPERTTNIYNNRTVPVKNPDRITMLELNSVRKAGQEWLAVKKIETSK